MAFLRTLIVLACIALVCSEVVDFKRCPGVDDSCVVNEVRVNPCPQALNHRACNIRRRKPHTMAFDFTPSFDADALEASLVWLKSDTEELPLITLDRNGCNSAPCPIRAGQRTTYSTSVPIESKFPTSSYTIKWQLKAPTGQKCCFTTDIKVVR